jgi:translation initiation factor 2 subunit 2
VDFYDYDSLLDRAYSQLPEVTKTKARFEMPQVVVFFEGNKTLLKNFVPVAKMLGREEAHFQKFLTTELGAYATVSGDRLIFNKKLFGKKIGDSVKRYVAEYVLCDECGKPDTRITTLEGVKILKCEACGGWKPLKHL